MSWTQAQTGTSVRINSVYFVNQFIGWAAGEEGTILKTTNGGRIWKRQYSPSNYSIRSVFFPTESIGWAVGGCATILKTTTGGVTFVEDEQTETFPGTYYLSQNYPNPFNPFTVIRFFIPMASQVRISIYNILGEEIMKLVDEQKPAGTYEVEFNGKGLTSGVYFYKLSSGSFVNTKKMLLLK